MCKETTYKDLSVVNLRCELMVNPIGIDIEKPRFSWEISALKRGVMQRAYRIIVALSKQDLINEKNLVWDSGIVHSSDSYGVEYGGPLLQSRQRYFWKVRIWDNSGEDSGWSEDAFWEMGLLDLNEWQAKWIEPDRPAVKEERYNISNMAEMMTLGKDGDFSNLYPCPYFRKTFEADRRIKRARLYATAHGVYSVELNGKRIDSREFAPDFTSYDKILQYQTYDVTEFISNGKNVLGFIVADGWYVGKIGMLGWNCQYGNSVALLFQLEIEYDNGEMKVIVSDENVKYTTGPILYSDIFVGEKYDARLELPGWSCSDFDDSNWDKVRVADYGLENLVAQYGEPVRVVKEIKPVDILHSPKGETIIDFGQVIAGRVRMRVRGKAGTVVTLEHSEILDDEGNFLNNITGINKDQRDYYILKGTDEEIYEPHFTFHGFRYVRVTGYPGPVEIEQFTGVVLSSDMRHTGYFECSDKRINRLQENILWSQIGNMLSIPTDCPQRERAGWTGDIQIFAPTACFNMDVNAFLTRWLRNLKADQLKDGEIPVVSPYTESYKMLQKSMGSESSAGWGDACIIVPWALYNAYGDVRILKENYSMMIRWMSYVEKTAAENIPENLGGELDSYRRERQKYLWNTGFHFGDWLVPSLCLDMSSETVFKASMLTKDLVATCYYAHSAELLSKIAKILGKEDDAKYYAELSNKVKEAFSAEYVREDGRLSVHLQGLYIIALKFNMVSDSMREKLVYHLVNLIEQNGYRLDTGFLSTPFILDVLCENGREDIAFKILFQTKSPSWLYEVEHGATTIWESWNDRTPDGKINTCSYNHYAFGCVGDWLYRSVAGLKKDAPGYKHIVIKPILNENLTYAKASYHSVHGVISYEWNLFDGKMMLSVIIPPNTTASVYLPKAVLGSITESGNYVKDVSGIVSMKQDDEDVLLEIGSGHYNFEYSTTK